MDRMSARYTAKKLGLGTKLIYQIWQEMGLIRKNKLGDWTLTDLGKQHGGKMSINSYSPVPTFEFETIKKLMVDFLYK